MGWITLIQEILALPGQINSLLARIDALEASIAKLNQQAESAAISKLQADTNAAKTTAELKAEADQAAAVLRNL